MIPILCKNDLTGKVSEVTEIGDMNLFERLEESLVRAEPVDEVFRYELGNYIYTTIPEITYIARNENEVQTRVSSDYVRATIYQINRFIEDQTNSYLAFSHDIQYFIGAIRSFSDPEQKQFKFQNSDQQIKNVYELCSLLLAKSQYFRFITDDISITIKKEVPINSVIDDLRIAIMASQVLYEKPVIIKNISNIEPVIITQDYFGFIPFCILENAIKYSPSTGCGIIISYIKNDSGLDIQIGSTGITVPLDELSQISSPGFRSTTARINSIPGSGLGLSQAKIGASKLFGGSIEFIQTGKPRVINEISYSNTLVTIHVPKEACL